MAGHLLSQSQEMHQRLRQLREQAEHLPAEFSGLRTALDDLALDLTAQDSQVQPVDSPGDSRATPSVADAPTLTSDVSLQSASVPDAPASRNPYAGQCPPHTGSQDVLQAMLDQSHAQIAYLDPQLNFVAVNAAYARGSGYTREELVGRNHFDLFPNTENRLIFEHVRDTGEATVYMAKPFVFPNRPEMGTTYWDWTLMPHKDQEGAVCGLVLSLTDVTPRERARQALAESEHRYRLLVEAMAEGLATLDTDGTITYVNDEFCRMLGYAHAELIGRPHLTVVPQAQVALHRGELARRLRGEPGTFETVLMRRDGSLLPVIQAGRSLNDHEGRIIGTLAVFTDISALKTAEQALSVERDFASAVLDTADALVVVLDPRGHITRFNGACERLTGYALDEVRDVPFWDLFVIPEEMEEVQATFRQLRAGQFPNHHENYWLARDGSRRLVAWSNTVILDAEGAVAYIVSTGIDVTEARRAEEQTRNLARLPGENPNPVMRISPDGLVLYANRASAALRAMWATQVGLPLPDSWRALSADVLRENQVRTIELPCGETVLSVDLIPIAEAGYVNLYARDITVQVQTEEKLRSARDELEVRVQERTRELEEANRALEAMSRSDRRQRQAAEALLRATVALNSSLNLDQVLDHILAQTQYAIPCSAVAVIPMSGKTAYIARQRGLDERVWSEAKLSALLPPDAQYDPSAAAGPRKPVLITDRLAHRYAPSPAGLEWVRSLVAAPLQVEQEVIGTLCALSEENDSFNQEAAQLIEGFAAHAATAIRNAALYEAQLHARELAERLAVAEAAITRTLDLDTVIDSLLEHLHRLTDYDGTGIALMTDKDRLTLRASRGRTCLLGKDGIIDAETSPTLRALLETQESALIHDLRVHHEGDERAQETNDAVSWLGVPMIVGGQTIGICELCRQGPHPFTREHQQVAEALVGRAAVAIQNAWLFGQVRTGQERLQALSRRLVEVQETERRYIARELHDEAAQALVSLKVGLGLLEREAERPEAVCTGVGKLRDVVDGIMDSLHRLTIYLRPASLDHLGLEPALRQHIEALCDQHNLTVAYEVLGLHERLAPDIEIAIFRIVQEALTNVVRHARATRVDVLLELRGDKLIALVEDNGVGFDPSAQAGEHHLGLVGMRERAEMLGGNLIVESKPNQGTTVLVEVPRGA